MIRGLWYGVRCDVCGAEPADLRNGNQFRVQNMAEIKGWTFRRRLDGEVARRGGKDRCPTCTPAFFPKGRAWVSQP